MAIQLLCALLFSGIFIFFAGRQMQNFAPRRFLLLASLLLFFGFSLRIILGFTTKGYEADINTFKSWAQTANHVGLQNIYRQDIFLDYPPGYIYILVLADKLRQLFGLPIDSNVYTLLLKLPSIFGDLLCAGMLLYAGRRRKNPATGLFLAGAYLFCPAVLLNSSVWGQVDSFCLTILAASLLLLYRERYIPAAALFGLSIICKPQMLIFIPVYIFFAIKQRKWKQLVLCPLVAAAVILLVALPFTKNFDYLWLVENYQGTLGGYPYYTVNAYNFWALLGRNWAALPTAGTPVNILLHGIGPVLATAACGGIILLSKRKDAMFGGAIAVITLVYLFTVKMHERYLFHVLFLLLLACLFAEDRRLRFAFGAVSLAHFINVAYVLYLLNNFGSHYDPNEPLVKGFAAFQLLACGYLLYAVFRLYLHRPLPLKEISIRPDYQTYLQGPAPSRLGRLDLAVMLSVTCLYAALAFWGLGSHETALTSWTPAQDDRVTLAAELAGNSLTFIPGIAPEEKSQGMSARVSADVRVEISQDGRHWHEAATLTGSVFTWDKISLPEPADFIRLTALDGNVCLNEIALTGDAHTGPIPLTILSGNGTALIDEQSVVPENNSYFNSMYFDEIYHARTAYENLLHLEPYENTHPPFGKLLISLGILLFGMNPFGWRFMGALFGVLMLPVLYHLLKQLFHSTYFSAAGMLLLALDFMHFTQTRIATIDTYAVFFILLMYDAMVMFMKKDLRSLPMGKLLPPLLASGLFMGIGIASKWTVAYGALGLAALLFIKLLVSFLQCNGKAEKQAFGKKGLWICLWCCLFFIAVPLCIYFTVFLPYTTLPDRSVFSSFIRYQVHMYNYHAKLQAEHFFSSPWYAWPLIVKPIWFYFNGSLPNQDNVRTISSFGNPALWWPAIPAMLYSFYAAVRRKALVPVAAGVGFLSVYLPWVLISRLTFIYHYFTAVPFLILALIYCFSLLQKFPFFQKKVFSFGKPGAAVGISRLHAALAAFVLVNLLCFILFFPVISGAETTRAYANSLEWFSTWYFA